MAANDGYAPSRNVWSSSKPTQWIRQPKCSRERQGITSQAPLTTMGKATGLAQAQVTGSDGMDSGTGEWGNYGSGVVLDGPAVLGLARRCRRRGGAQGGGGGLNTAPGPDDGWI